MTKTTSPAEFVRPATDFEVMQQEHIERLKAELAEARAEIEHKDKLIEQMREALNILVASAPPSGPLWHGSAEMQIAMAALSAERGE